MFDLFIALTLLTMGAQFGIALAASIVVHPILVSIKQTSAIEVFKPFFAKTHKIVLVMSILVSLLTLIASVISGNWWWFSISMIMHLNGPYTYFMMMPLNRRLMAEEMEPESEHVKEDLRKWGYLHGVRSFVNGIVFFALIVLTIL